MIAPGNEMRWWWVALGCWACGGYEPQDLPSSHRWGARLHAPLPTPNQLVVIVDDADDAPTAAWRAAAATGVRRSLERFWEMATPFDPAVWTPMDLDVVLVLPSRVGQERIIGPPAQPALSLAREDVTAEDVDAAASAVAALLATNTASATDGYSPIVAATDTLALLAGERAPIGATESALLAALARPTSRSIHTAVMSLRDDTSPLAPSAYDMSLGEQAFGHALLNVLLPGADTPPCMDLATATLPRLAAWTEHMRSRYSVWASPQILPCGDPQLEQYGVFPTVDVLPSGSAACTSRPIAVDAAGHAQCRIFVEAAICDPARGWQVAADGRCEIGELDGADLEACRSTVDCQGCPSGWCVHEPLEALDHVYACPAGSHLVRLRFTAKSVVGSGATFEIACELQS